MSNRSRQSGMVLVTVLMSVMVMSVFLVLILSQNLSHSQASQSQLDKTAQQVWCQGVVTACYSSMAFSGSTTCADVTVPDQVGNKRCTATLAIAPVAGQSYSSVQASCTCT